MFYGDARENVKNLYDFVFFYLSYFNVLEFIVLYGKLINKLQEKKKIHFLYVYKT